MGQQPALLLRVLDTALKRPAALADLLASERTRLFNQVRVAHWIGEMAVGAGRREVGKRLAALRGGDGESDRAAAEAPPFDGYDALVATEVVALLDQVPRVDLALIRSYEAATRARRTILNRIDRMIG